MKFYDNEGNTHNSMIGAMGANVANRFRRTKVGCKFDGAAKRAEAQLDQIMHKEKEDKKREPLSEYKIDEIVGNIMMGMKDPIRDLHDNKLDSKIGNEMFIKTLIKIILYNTTDISIDDVSNIALKLSPLLLEEFVLVSAKKD